MKRVIYGGSVVELGRNGPTAGLTVQLLRSVPPKHHRYRPAAVHSVPQRQVVPLSDGGPRWPADRI